VDDLVGWIEGLFGDCSARAPFGISWDLDRAEPPLTARVTPADHPTTHVALRRDDVRERIDFAARVQALLDAELERPVPPCPNHQIGLVPVGAGDVVEWCCPEGDFRSRVGDYREALWPPAPDDDSMSAAPMLAERFRRRGVTGVGRLSVELRDGRLLASVQLRPEGDETAVRSAAAPVPVQVEWVEGVRTVRVERPATETEPAHRALTRAGAPLLLAALRGRLHRAGTPDNCDFLVGGAHVRLLPDHRIGPPGGPLVLDASGVPFAEEGDAVCCVGGSARPGPVRGERRVFNAGELRVYD
jgi:hypothetical protein